MLLCAIIFGVRGMTISLHAAQEETTGARWACSLCDFLSFWVQRHHCADQRRGLPMGGQNYLRAIAGLLLLCTLLWWVADGAVRLVFWGIIHA
jgi:hypothetical protein